jgi:hypothetical protein
MVSNLYQSEKNATDSLTVSQAGLFDFRPIAMAAPPRQSHNHASRLEQWAGHETDGARTFNGYEATLAAKSKKIKKRYFFWIFLILVLMQLSQLMAKNDDKTGGWMPPIEPPGSVIVTSLSEGSPIQRSGNKATENPQSQASLAPAIPAARPLPPSAQASDSEASLRQAIQQWSQAWSRQAINPYLDLYASDFEPSKGLSRAAWVSQRTQRIASKKSIQHEVQNLSIQFNAGQATVRFMQIYQDEGLRASERKTMQWVWRNGRWQITREVID